MFAATTRMTPKYLYVHVPFCVRRCAYCDFAVDAVREPPLDQWLDAVAGEIRLVARERGWDRRLQLRTLYVGGGTPSLLGTGAMDRLLEAIDPIAGLAEGAEWTCEANPESFTPDLAEDWRRAGVNRLSLGAQTFHADSLRWMGRMHGPEGIERAVRTARAHGFDDVSVDLIFGLPPRLGRDWSSDLDRAIALEPDHVSLYGLTAEEATPLGRWVREQRETLVDEDGYADEYLLAVERMGQAGFEHYEVSNFARPGRRSVHNAAYWTGEPYVALGPGAHSFFPPLRRWNERSWETYRDRVIRGELPTAGEETVSDQQRAIEAIWLGLRTVSGLDLDLLGPGQANRVHGWVRQGWARNDGTTLRLTAEGWLLLDRLAADLAGDPEIVDARSSNGAGSLPKEENVGTQPPIDVARHLVQISATSNLAD